VTRLTWGNPGTKTNQKVLRLTDTFTQQRLLAGSMDLYAEAHLEFDRVLLRAVLTFTQGNQQQAARVLGVARQTLRNRLRELSLSITRSVEAEQEPTRHPGPQDG